MWHVLWRFFFFDFFFLCLLFVLSFSFSFIFIAVYIFLSHSPSFQLNWRFMFLVNIINQIYRKHASWICENTIWTIWSHSHKYTNNIKCNIIDNSRFYFPLTIKSKVRKKKKVKIKIYTYCSIHTTYR